MVQYVTRSRLIELGRENLNENLAKVAKSESRTPNGATFLSHSSKDDDAMPGVVRILENHGASVYLDKKDPTLASKPVREIATTLRTRVSAAKKFILFASDNVKDSKWVPWELGLADVFKNSRNTAIFPAPEKAYEAKWTEQEYLGVYDRIVWGGHQDYVDEIWMVWDQTDNTAISLDRWLARP